MSVISEAYNAVFENDLKSSDESLEQFLDVEDIAMELSLAYAKSAEAKAQRSSNDHMKASTAAANKAELYKTYGTPGAPDAFMRDSKKEYNISQKRNRQLNRFKTYADKKA